MTHPGSRPLTTLEFAAKWQNSTTKERSAAQEHFIDLCRMLGEPTPNEADPSGDWYAFEKGAQKLGGGDGFADVWKRAHFAWEYKGKRKDLESAYQQVARYRESLENPPLLVVCDTDRFEVHTNFTNTRKAVYRFTLDDFRTHPKEPLRILKAVMTNPEELRPDQTREQVTELAADQFAQIAGLLQERGEDPHRVAHFLCKLLFCLFAEDVGLLSKGLVGRLIDGTRGNPERTAKLFADLFEKMARKGGGFFGAEEIQWFNGGLFADAEVLSLESDEWKLVRAASELDWSNVEPSILGTLFERGLDPKKRSQLGAHYTDLDSIMRVIEPVLLQSLRREFEAMKEKVVRLLARGKKADTRAKGKENPTRVFRGFLERLRSVRVLDPACGSGNFLYVALRALKDLEKEALEWGAVTLRLTQELPGIGPEVVHGIELNEYAAELARVTVWIGEIQWMLANGYGYQRDPILRPLQTIENRDGILARTSKGEPVAADWPDAEFIVGNPPFLGGKKLKTELGDEYVDDLFAAWEGRVPHEADLVTYWHEKAREMIAEGRCSRAGLLATQGIRGGANLEVLKKVKESGDIICAWSDEPWVVEGAAVRVSIVAQDDGSERLKMLDGAPVAVIHADLTGGGKDAVDLTTARRLRENLRVAFMGDTKGGAFDIPGELAAEFLAAPTNVNGRRNSDVVVPWVNGLDVTRRPRGMFIIDFGVDMTEREAAKYEAAYEHIRKEVKPIRSTNKREAYARRWWLHVEPRPALRDAVRPLRRFIATARVAKHRLFVWMERPALPDCQLIAVAREDAWVFGVLHSRIHEIWALKQGTQLEDRPRYTPTTTFETFPFPWPLNTPEKELTRKKRAQRDAIAEAAEALDAARRHWLNPPELVKAAKPPASGFPAVFVPRDDEAAMQLKARTLTKLYNEKPQWLVDAHETLDRAVLDAYSWPADASDDFILRKLLDLNLSRPAATDASPSDDDGDEAA